MYPLHFYAISQFLALDPGDIIACRKRDFQIDVLVSNGKEAQRKYKDAVIDHVSINEILLLLVKGNGYDNPVHNYVIMRNSIDAISIFSLGISE